jgi:arylsulfatase A-like enzyme
VKRIYLALLSLALVSGVVLAFKMPPPFKNVILIAIDTLNAHHLGAYGAERSPSPNIDQLAKNGIVFERAYSAAPWTKPAFASMFTSLYPSEHGVTAFDRILSEDKFTVGEYFKSKGFSTAGIVSHILVQPQFGYAQGFDYYELIPFKGNVHSIISSLRVTDMATRWLESNSERPFFMFLHYFDPHNNYYHHKKFDRTSWYKGPVTSGMDLRELKKLIPNMTKEDVVALRGFYDEEIAFTDFSIGLLLSYLRDHGLDKDTLIVLTADHGEELTERGYIGHTRTLYDELVRVPFIFNLPGRFAPARVKEPVSTMDLLPTMQGLFGDKKQTQIAGEDLSEILLAGAKEPLARKIFSEVDYRAGQITAHKLGVVDGNLKLVLDKSSQQYEFFDLKKDPSETINIEDSSSPDFKRLQAAIKGFQARYQTDAVESNKLVAPKAESQDKMDQLKSLGYL